MQQGEPKRKIGIDRDANAGMGAAKNHGMVWGTDHSGLDGAGRLAGVAARFLVTDDGRIVDTAIQPATTCAPESDKEYAGAAAQR